MALVSRSLFAAVAAAALVGGIEAAAAQGYADPEVWSEPMVEMSAPAPAPAIYAATPGWRGDRAERGSYARRASARASYPPARRLGHQRAYRGYAIAGSVTAMRAYATPALPPAVAVAHTLPTRVIYAEPAPRTAYYNEPVIIDGLRSHRAARRVTYDPCGDGCLRSAY